MNDSPQLTVLDLAKMARKSYEEPLPRRVLGSPTTIFRSDATSTQGYYLPLTINGTKLGIIVFRGSKGARDWIRDLLLWSCRYRRSNDIKVQATALGSWESVSSKVFDAVKADGPDHLLITGHSLGGQLCMPCADELYIRFGLFSTRVTFGALPFGKKRFVEYMSEVRPLRHLRFVVGKDIATCNLLHQIVYGYRHDALAINLSPWWDLRRYTAHSISNYEKEIGKELSKQPDKWRLI